MATRLSAHADLPRQFASFFREETFQPYAWLLSQKLSEGHVCIDLADFPNAKESLPEAYQKLLAEGRCNPHCEKLVGSETDETKPFILHNNRLYLQRYFRYETACIARIRQFAETEATHIAARTEALGKQKELLWQLFPQNNSNGAPDWQLFSAICAALQNFTIITGGPGTGKTTTVSKLLSLLFTLEPGLKVALAAPTGKAAARMAESLRQTPLPGGLEHLRTHFETLSPATIHRLLGSKRHSPYFHHNAENPLPFDLIIADESSMIDVALFAKLLQSIGPDTRLILLGDKSQLASVEAGSLFGDLCSALPGVNAFCAETQSLLNGLLPEGAMPLPDTAVCEKNTHPLFQRVLTLQVSHRFRDDAGIGRLSKAVIQNDEAVLDSFLTANTDPQVRIFSSEKEDFFEDFALGYKAFIEEKDITKALRLLARQRVLVVTRQGRCGLEDTNRAIEDFLRRKGLLHPLGIHYENRPVILTRNYPDLGLFNGDTGIMRRDEKGVLKVWFEDAAGNLLPVLPGYVAEAQTAFALTVHKSQGSEFKEVFIRLPESEEMALLSRELLYTAITRAKERVWIEGAPSVIKAAAARRIARSSGIGERF